MSASCMPSSEKLKKEAMSLKGTAGAWVVMGER
jgi:hypothetical protein